MARTAGGVEGDGSCVDVRCQQECMSEYVLCENCQVWVFAPEYRTESGCSGPASRDIEDPFYRSARASQPLTDDQKQNPCLRALLHQAEQCPSR
jgi:hypothetical protein